MYHGDKVLDVLLAFTLPKLLEPCVILIRCYIHKKILLSLLLHLGLDILPFMFYDLFVCYCRCRRILKHSTNLQVMFTMETQKNDVLDALYLMLAEAKNTETYLLRIKN